MVGAAAAAIVQAIKASGVIVRVEPGEFSKLINRANDPLIVLAEGGLFSKNYQYLMSYKGIAFFTKSSDPLALPSRIGDSGTDLGSRKLAGLAEESFTATMTIQTAGRQILIHGLALILAGLLWGFAPPMTPFPRLALGAHIQFETNGLLFMVVGILLLTVPNRVGRKALWVMVASAWLTWLMVLSEIANSWWGTSQMLPIAAKQAGAMGAAPWQELIVKLCHIPAALGLILSFVLLIIAFVKYQPIKLENSPVFAEIQV